MALKLLQPGNQPLGQFDGLDSDMLTLKGGEVCTFANVAVASSDKAAKDSFDGYTNESSAAKRVVITHTFASSATRPLMLADEGTTGYGTLFGSVVGGTVGQNVSGTVLGPHTVTGSGKVTCWEKPGLYAVSLDACDAGVSTSTGLNPVNTTLATGAPLYITTAGLLTPNTTRAVGTDAGSLCGRFISFETTGSLVTTQSSMVSALNSPSGQAATTRSFNFAVFYFNPSA